MHTAVQDHQPPPDDRDYESLRECLRRSGERISGPLFTTETADLFDVFLGALPSGHRQHYNCRACRRFVEHFGGLVAIDAAGASSSAFWSDSLPPTFADAGRVLDAIVTKARVNGVFLSGEATWGLVSNQSPKAVGGAWYHMHVVPTASLRFRHSLKTASQASAEKIEEHGMLCRGLAEFPIELVRQAHFLLTTGALYRSEKCIGIAKWLLDLHEAIAATANRRLRDNLIWRAVAAAPPGFCHVRTTMISTLLEDLAVGKAVEEIKRSFDAKMSPIQYQRPQAAPTDGQLAAAESVIAKLASAGALARRYARIEEIAPHAIWTPKPISPPNGGGGVFDHLRSDARARAPLSVPTQAITWEKFRRTVLPEATAIEVLLPSMGSYFAFVTADDLAAPPILQWDREDRRNPVSWYVYHGGSPASGWGLLAGHYCEVTAITAQPSGWMSESTHQGDGAYFVLRGARDTRTANLCLFPETMKSEYHGIRSAIEAYSRSRSLGGAQEASACGLAFQKASAGSHAIEVRTVLGQGRVSYRIDRWD